MDIYACIYRKINILEYIYTKNYISQNPRRVSFSYYRTLGKIKIHIYSANALYTVNLPNSKVWILPESMDLPEIFYSMETYNYYGIYQNIHFKLLPIMIHIASIYTLYMVHA